MDVELYSCYLLRRLYSPRWRLLNDMAHICIRAELFERGENNWPILATLIGWGCGGGMVRYCKGIFGIRVY